LRINEGGLSHFFIPWSQYYIIMANANSSVPQTELPDWWQREKQRRQLLFLVFLGAVLLLIGYFYWAASTAGVRVGVIDFDTTDYISFVRREKDGNTTLYVMRADGSGLRRMTDAEDKSGKETPVWTMDGSHLIYVSNRNDPRTWQVYIVGGGEPSQLTYGTGNKSAPVVSPDGKRVAFITQGAIKTMLPNGQDVYQLMPVPTAGEGAGEEGATRPNMDAATSIRGPFRTVSLSSDGSGCAGVKELSGEESSEGSEIALGNQAAFVIPPGGDRSLVLDTGREVGVAWEPNGKRLASAFAGLQERGASQKNLPASGIVLWNFENPQKPQPQPVFVAAEHTVEPRNVAWAPDGSKIAFEVWRVKGEEDRKLLGIVVMAVSKNFGIRIDNAQQADALGQSDRLMVKATPDARPQRPLWSPDGTRLLYEVTRKDGKHDIWIINADGTDPINLTNGEKDGTDNVQASWSPRRK